MQPIDLKGRNIIIGENQEGVFPLPAIAVGDKEGRVITCWEMTEEEAEEFIRTRKLYLAQWTFGNRLQPLLPAVHLEELL